ncbi:type II secretion system F family protein [Halomonas aquamarina]|uniref:Type II secretion system F family protein n=1 Tax=Vreelandella aquamarina TaxID=77097 RepID=A0ACC5VSC3_9GAMM|nr:type II secretion system F family protein [Halomonas aquamarina]MBZ5487043.1 type II secretion system F family protein [Halomonas aquamarina]
MNATAYALFGMSAAFLLAAWIMLQASRRRAVDERINERLNRDSVRVEPRVRKRRGLSLWLRQAGIRLPAWLSALLAGLFAILLLMLLQVSWFMPLLALAGMALLVYLVGQWRAQKRLDRMIEQMPGLLDHMVRSIKSGRTVGDAMLLAMQRSPEPLNRAMAPVRKDIELGMPMAEAVLEFASLYRREEFHILALGMRINQRYGGNASDMLQSLMAMIRDRERASRQLRAMTGETRISAVVLAGLPLGLGGYILLSNPDFLLTMWASSAGRVMLMISLVLQFTGCFILWRMLKSI